MTTQAFGASLPRWGGEGRVTGAQEYVADIRLTDVLQAKLVTIDAARARLISIDKTAAEKVPGVRLVMTAAALPHPVPRYGPHAEDRPGVARGGGRGTRG